MSLQFLQSLFTVGHNLDVDFVEAEATLRAVRFAHELGFADVHLEGLFGVVNAFMAANCDEFELAGFGPLIMEARQVSSFFHSFTVSHVRRTGNVVAHRLARLAILYPGLRVWMEEVPTSVASAVHLDVVGS
ncbi:hypothetical protein LOK49_LG11G01269 [Camellia lanceoleosa]|uniref:Uncharacterized protein n=1 Tax=Camellia lanceoleosa TaxID=1840588 RepID=A0ACC0G305_9ERIC|nr:hypothetical protein LOK49_LG11G01269 [Camellia lanceoleosa]